MNYIKSVIFCFIFIALYNCSSNETKKIDFTGKFFPLTVNNEWNYDVEATDNLNNTTTTSEDVLIVESETSTGYKLIANNGETANGVMTNILISGKLALTETTLSSNGTLVSPINGFDFGIALDNFLLYNTEASVDEQLSTKSGAMTQTIQDYPITINYTLTSTQLENIDNMIVNGVNYEAVTSSKILLQINATTEITILSFKQTVSILDTQDVLLVTAYYAKDTGLIKAEADTNYELNSNTLTLIEQAGFDLSDIETSSSQTNIQELTSFILTE